jgi:hypothetical protein
MSFAIDFNKALNDMKNPEKLQIEDITDLPGIDKNLVKHVKTYNGQILALGDTEILKLPKITIICEDFIGTLCGIPKNHIIKMILEGLKKLRKKQKFAVVVPDYREKDVGGYSMLFELSTQLRGEDIPVIIVPYGPIERLIYRNHRVDIQKGQILYVSTSRKIDKTTVWEMTATAGMLGDAIAVINVDDHNFPIPSAISPIEIIANDGYSPVWASSISRIRLNAQVRQLTTDGTISKFNFGGIFEASKPVGFDQVEIIDYYEMRQQLFCEDEITDEDICEIPENEQIEKIKKFALENEVYIFQSKDENWERLAAKKKAAERWWKKVVIIPTSHYEF